MLVVPPRSVNAFLLCLVDDDDWKTLNRLREKRYKQDKRMSDYFEIPKGVTLEELQAIEDGMATGVDDLEDPWSQTVPKQGTGWMPNPDSGDPMVSCNSNIINKQK